MSQRDGELRRILRANLPDGDWQSIESGGTVTGLPDSNYCFPGGHEGWVEGKLIHGWTVKMRPAQIGWMDRRSRRGGRCFVFVRRLNDRADELHVLRGSEVVAFSGARCNLLEHRASARFAGGPSRWDWGAIRKILMS